MNGRRHFGQTAATSEAMKMICTVRRGITGRTGLRIMVRCSRAAFKLAGNRQQSITTAAGCSPRCKIGDLQPGCDRDLGEARERYPEGGASDRLRNHANQIGSSFSPVCRGGQKKHGAEGGAKCQMPVGEVGPEDAEDSEANKCCDEENQRSHSRPEPQSVTLSM